MRGREKARERERERESPCNARRTWNGMRLQSAGSVTSACKRHEVDPVPWFAKQSGRQSAFGSSIQAELVEDLKTIVFQLDQTLRTIKNPCNSYSAMSWRASTQYFVSIWVGGGIRKFVLPMQRCTSCQRVGEMFGFIGFVRAEQEHFWVLSKLSFLGRKAALRPVRGMWQRGGSYPNHQVLRCAPQWHHWIAHGMQPDAYYIQHIYI